MLEERKKEILKQLDSVHKTEQNALLVTASKVKQKIENLHQVNQLIVNASQSELVSLKEIVDEEVQDIMDKMPDINSCHVDIHFVSNHKAIQEAIYNKLGYLKQSTDFKQYHAQTMTSSPHDRQPKTRQPMKGRPQAMTYVKRDKMVHIRSFGEFGTFLP